MVINTAAIGIGARLPAALGGNTTIPTVRTKKKVPINSITYFTRSPLVTQNFYEKPKRSNLVFLFVALLWIIGTLIFVSKHMTKNIKVNSPHYARLLPVSLSENKALVEAKKSEGKPP